MKNTKAGEVEARRVGAVVLTVGYRPDTTLIDSFTGTAPVVLPIGGAETVKNTGTATRSGYAAAYGI